MSTSQDHSANADTRWKQHRGGNNRIHSKPSNNNSGSGGVETDPTLVAPPVGPKATTRYHHHHNNNHHSSRPSGNFIPQQHPRMPYQQYYSHYNQRKPRRYENGKKKPHSQSRKRNEVSSVDEAMKNLSIESPAPEVEKETPKEHKPRKQEFYFGEIRVSIPSSSCFPDDAPSSVDSDDHVHRKSLSTNSSVPSRSPSPSRSPVQRGSSLTPPCAEDSKKKAKEEDAPRKCSVVVVDSSIINKNKKKTVHDFAIDNDIPPTPLDFEELQYQHQMYGPPPPVPFPNDPAFFYDYPPHPPMPNMMMPPTFIPGPPYGYYPYDSGAYYQYPPPPPPPHHHHNQY